jgi:hypothetical protein
MRRSRHRIVDRRVEQRQVARRHRQRDEAFLHLIEDDLVPAIGRPADRPPANARDVRGGALGGDCLEGRLLASAILAHRRRLHVPVGLHEPSFSARHRNAVIG